ncbi:hypothetical protein [Lichenibacterium dinghuense]|uniref:hypothetical protein n=1 Tax=Lichenibacterium dinghuense TaxID=2895977 RepID=UPI001F3D6F8B|nr:hypothetical protein [Lichenibacterium sp. 6Y81]
MKVVLDAEFLLLLLRPDHAVPRDPATGDEVPAWRARLGELVARLEEERSSVVIPTPVLAALLLRAGRATDAVLRRIEARRAFQVQPFDLRAAVEAAAMAWDGGEAEAATGAAERARQVVAIARVNGAARIYSDDAEVGALGRRHGLDVVGLAALPLPAQGKLDLGEPAG